MAKVRARKRSYSGPGRRWRKYFARRLVYPWERPSVMRKHIYTGAMGHIWFSLISGIFFVYFGTTIGMTPLHWGLMGGISSWLITAQLLSALWTERTGRRKVIWFAFAAADRGMRLVGIVLSLVLWSAGWPHAAVVLMAAVCFANLCSAMALPPWMSWLADIVPENEHGSFLGRRLAWIAFAIICVVVPAGLFVDLVPPDYKIHAVTAVFILATALGIVDLLIHGTIPEPMMNLPERNHFLLQFAEPLRDRRFRPWLIFNGSWTFSMTLGGALSTVYFVNDLGIKDNFLGGAIVLNSFGLIGCILTSSWAGRLVDRLGPKKVIFWGHCCWAFLPLFWVLATPASALVWLGLGSAVGGAAGTAGLNAANKLITRLPAPERRATYVAVSSSLGNVAAGLGVMTAGVVLRLLEGWSAPLGGLLLGGFHVLFIVSICLRLASTLLLVPRLHDLPGAERRRLSGI